MTCRQTLFLAAATTMVLGLAGCGSGGDMESAAPPPPERSGAKPQPAVATGPMPEELRKKFKMPPMSPGAAARGRELAAGRPGGVGRRPETEPRKYD